MLLEISGAGAWCGAVVSVVFEFAWVALLEGFGDAGTPDTFGVACI